MKEMNMPLIEILGYPINRTSCNCVDRVLHDVHCTSYSTAYSTAHTTSWKCDVIPRDRYYRRTSVANDDNPCRMRFTAGHDESRTWWWVLVYSDVTSRRWWVIEVNHSVSMVDGQYIGYITVSCNWNIYIYVIYA